MAYVVANRVKETALIIGTGSATCLGAVSGYLPFSSKMSIGDTCPYITFNPSQSQWETGIGTYSASGTISRTIVKTSSNNNNKVVFNGDVVNILIGQSVENVPDYNPITQTLSANPVSSGTGNNLTIIGGSGVISGSGGNLILQGGMLAGSGSTGKVIVKQVTSQTSNLQEWQDSSGNAVAYIKNDGSIWTTINPINYTYSGTLTVPPIIILDTPNPVQIGSSVADYSGKWASTIIISSANQWLTSISFTDLQGITGNFTSSTILVLTSLSFPVLTTIGGSFNPTNTNSLTSLNLPLLTTVGGSFTPNLMASLTSLDLPALTTVGGNFQPNSMAALTSLSVPALTTVGGNFSLSSMTALTSLSVPALTTVGGSFSSTVIGTLTSLSLPALTTVRGSVTTSSFPALTSMSFPVLTTVGGSFSPDSMAALTSLSLPALTTVGGNFLPAIMAALTSISLPALTTVGGSFGTGTMASLTSLSVPVIERIGTNLTSGSIIIISTNTAALTTFQLPSTLKQIGNGAGNVVITSAALNQASVDSILVRLAALDGTNGTTLFSNRTVTITGTSSAPSSTGLAAKSTLVSRGCTVTTN